MWNPNAKSAAKINKKQRRQAGTAGTTPHNTLSLYPSLNLNLCAKLQAKINKIRRGEDIK